MTPDEELRFECLKLAAEILRMGDPDAVVATATKLFAFAKGSPTERGESDAR